MTFRIITRGASSDPLLADFRCPVHGVFEALVERGADIAACPHVDPTGLLCAATSPWTPSPIVGRVKLGEVSRGKSDGAPFPHALKTEALADGQSMSEFRANRRKVWAERRRAEIRSKL